MALINNKTNNYTQKSMPEVAKPDSTASPSPHKVTYTPTEDTQGLRFSSSMKHKKLSSRRALKLLDLPDSKEDFKIRDHIKLQEKLDHILSTNVTATRKKLQKLQVDSLSKTERKAIADTIRNLEIIESLKKSKDASPKEFEKHLAIASGYIGHRIELPIPELTWQEWHDYDPPIKALAHIVCWLEHAAFSVGRIEEERDTPKNIAIKMKVLNKETDSILKQIKKIQKKNARAVVPWLETLQIPRNHSERKAKKQWVQDTLRLGLDSPICKELHLTPEIKQALKNLESIDPQKQCSTFFVTEDYNTKDLKNWNQADALARLIAGRKTKGDMIHYYAESQRSNKFFRLAMKILDGFGRQTLTGSNPESHLVYCERLTVAKAIDVCDDRFDKPLDKALDRLNSDSPEYAKLQKAKKVRDRLKKIDFNPEKNVNDEIRKAWWIEHVTVFSQLTPHVPEWELLNIWPESSLCISWLEQTFNKLNKLPLAGIERAQETSDPAVTETKTNPEEHKKPLTPDERNALSEKCIQGINETKHKLEHLKTHYQHRFPNKIIGLKDHERWSGIGETETVQVRITKLSYFLDDFDKQWYWQAKNWVETMGMDIKSVARQNFDITLDLETDDKELSDEQLQKKQILIEKIGIWAEKIIDLCRSKHSCTAQKRDEISRLEDEIKKNA